MLDACTDSLSIEYAFLPKQIENFQQLMNKIFVTLVYLASFKNSWLLSEKLQKCLFLRQLESMRQIGISFKDLLQRHPAMLEYNTFLQNLQVF